MSTRRKKPRRVRQLAPAGRARTDWGSAHLGEHLDCGCRMREVLVLEVKRCAECGHTGETMVSAGNVIPMATSAAERGGSWSGAVSCGGCMGEREVAGVVL